jgi:hypothetical protein
MDSGTPRGTHPDILKTGYMERRWHCFLSAQKRPAMAKPADITAVKLRDLTTLVHYLPRAPVEGIGYKNIVNLPDWPGCHDICVKW